MNKSQFKIVVYTLLFITVLLISCDRKQVKITKSPPIAYEDSLIVADIENDISFGKTDTGLAKIQRISTTENYLNHNFFRLKLLNLKARLLAKNKKSKQALELCDDIISICEKDMDNLRLPFVHANLVKGDIYFELRNYQLAYKYYYQVRSSIQGFEADCEYAQYDYRIAIILFKQKKYAESIKNFRWSYDKYFQCKKDFNRQFRLQEILNNIGICYYKIGNFDSAIYYYNASLIHQNSIKPKDNNQSIYLSIAKGVSFGNIGKVYLEKGEYSKAIELLKYNITTNTKPKHDRNDALTSIVALANYYLSIKNYAEFNKTISIAYAIPESWKFKDQFKNIYNLESQYYEQQKNYKLAFEYLNKFNYIKDSLIQIQQDNTNSDIQLTIESLEKENKINALIKASESRTTIVYIVASISIALIIYIITISGFLKYSNKKNKDLFNSNNEIIRQKELLDKANHEISYNLEVLKTKDLEKNKILSIVAHDLRNPNNAIVSIADTLLEDKSITQEQAELISLIKTSANSNKDLIQEILYFAKPGQFAKTTDFILINCKELLQQTISLNIYKANQKHINIELGEIDPRLEINAQIEKMRRAISNVIINAIKFSHHNTTIKIYTTNTLEYINIHIKDQGIGIPDRIKSAIFISDPIIRRLGTDGEASFGLGLSIVKQTIEEHQGKISFHSNASGTEFIISLPLSKQNT